MVTSFYHGKNHYGFFYSSVQLDFTINHDKEFYNEVSDEADEKENGTYIFLIKKSDTVFYQGCMEIMDSQFDLHYVDIHDGDTVYHVDFDA